MKMAKIAERLIGSGGAKWEVHNRAKHLAAAGRDVILLTIGEPDVPPSSDLLETAISAIRAGRTNYSDGRGEPELRDALADYYTKRDGRAFGPGNILCFPGTQTALYGVMRGLAESGDEVLVGDPMYATYEGIIRSSGADVVKVPLRPEHGFRIQAEDIKARITERTRALLITTPHNPTGAILTPQDIREIGALAKAHDFWIISDEVYSELIFGVTDFKSPQAFEDLQDRVVVVSSISKSHAAPGFRSGWCVGSEDFIDALLPLAEAMLFGNQPFIADMTAKAVRDGSLVADGMRHRFAARAKRLEERLGHNKTCLRVNRPDAGMFALMDVAGTGLDGDAFANALLDQKGVAVMPGSSFGDGLNNWVRVALTVPDAEFDAALTRIKEFCDAL